MTWSIAVSFENPTQAGPATVRVETDARGVTTAVRKAIVAAKRQLPGQRWQSLVILVERGRADQALERPESMPTLRTAEGNAVGDMTDGLCCAGTAR